MLNKELILITSLILIFIIGVVIYDYQVRKIMADTIKRIATMGNVKKVIKSPITAMAFIWGWFWGDKD